MRVICNPHLKRYRTVKVAPGSLDHSQIPFTGVTKLWQYRPSENDAVIDGKVGLYWTIKQ